MRGGRSRWVRRAACALGLLGVLAAAYLLVPGRYSGDALTNSMRRHSLASSVACRRVGAGEDRTCEFTVGNDSFGPSYDVRVTGRCWTARRDDSTVEATGEGATPQPRTYRGCIVVGDDLRPLGRFLGGDGASDL